MKNIYLYIGIFLLAVFLLISCGSKNPTSPTATVTITSIEPASGKTGDDITINGKGFGNVINTSYVSFNGANALSYSIWTDTVIQVKVPLNATTGKVKVFANGTSSNGVDFTVIILPVIENIEPVAAYVNDDITITGVNFGNTQGGSRLIFNNQPINVITWSNTKITFKVPQTDRNNALINVVVQDIKSNDVPFIIGNGGNTSSAFTGLWTGMLTESGIVNHFDFYINESGGTISGYGVQYYSLTSGNIFGLFSINGFILNNNLIGLNTTNGGFGFFGATLTSDLTTISGATVFNNGNYNITFTKK